jgi:hypothetical protein
VQPFLISALDGVGWVVKSTPRPFYPQERSPILNLQEAGWMSRPVWTSVKKTGSLGSTGVLSPNRPACSETL